MPILGVYASLRVCACEHACVSLHMCRVCLHARMCVCACARVRLSAEFDYLCGGALHNRASVVHGKYNAGRLRAPPNTTQPRARHCGRLPAVPHHHHHHLLLLPTFCIRPPPHHPTTPQYWDDVINTPPWISLKKSQTGFQDISRSAAVTVALRF